MKFICTIFYLFLAAIQLFLGSKSTKLILEELEGGRQRQSASSLIPLVIFLIVFAQFWLLTRLFPFFLISLLIVALILAIGMSAFIGAIVGFSLKEKKEKIATLTFVWNLQHPARGCSYMVVSTIVMLIGVIGTLWVFWSHRIGDAHARVWIAIFQFFIPQLVFIPSTIALSWPVVTSEFMDDDVRNASLANSFSSIIFQTLFLFFPVWVVRNEIQQVFGRNLTQLWIVLSIPLLAFMLGSLLPFFIGVHLYRAQSKIMLRWQETWLQDLYELVQLPAGATRNTAFSENRTKLENEIHERLSQHRIFEVYKSILTTNETAEPELLLPASSSEAKKMEPDEVTRIKKMFQVTKQFLRTGIQSQDNREDPQAQIRLIVQKYQSHLRDWDIGFEYLWNLLELYDVSADARTAEISGFVKARLDRLKATSEKVTPKSNVLAGAIITALSTSIVFLFKTYQVQIFDLIGHLAKLKT